MSSTRPYRRSMSLITIAVLGAAGVIATAPNASAAPSTTVVINEVYGGGGNSGATYRRDFIELQNRGSAPVDLDGWSVQYHSAGSTGAWQVTGLTGSVAPGGYYLVAEAQGAGGTADLPDPAITGTIPMSATGGTVALVDNSAALTCPDSTTCQSASVDLVGYNSAIAEGVAAPALTNTTSASRTDAADSDSNATDFTTGTPTPGAANHVRRRTRVPRSGAR